MSYLFGIGPMAMTIYIILVALLNLCVGYFAAVQLGFGRTWRSAGRSALTLPKAPEADAPTPDASKTKAAEPATGASDTSAASVEQPLEPRSEPPAPEPTASAAFEALAAASGLEEQKSPEAEESSEGAFETFNAEEEPTTQAETQQTPPTANDASSEPVETSEPAPGSSDLDASDFDEDAHSVVEACVADFKQELDRYRAQLGEIESRVREGAVTPQADQLQQCVKGLKSANSEFLDKQGGISRRLKSQQDHGQLADVAARVGRAMAQQEALVEFSNTNIEQIDVENDLETGFQQLLGETSLLSDNADQAHQTLRDAEESVAELRGDRGPQPGDADEVPRGYEHVKQSLNHWWSNDPGRTREMTVGVVGVDKTEQLRDQIGVESSRKLFDAVRTMIKDAVGDRGPILRHSPHVFVVVFHDTGAREATNVVEQIRQSVAAAKFAYRGESYIPVTVSCAVTQARAEDAEETLLDRVDATLKESSRYGENRTFLHADKHPAPVVPPQLDVVEVKVRL